MTLDQAAELILAVKTIGYVLAIGCGVYIGNTIGEMIGWKR
jgi:predicted MFS family arabinose efflux permease